MFISPSFLQPFLLLLLLSFTIKAVAGLNSLAFTFPPPASVQTQTTFNVGQNAHFTWVSTWPKNTLQIWQGPDDTGKMAHLDLLTNVTNTKQDFVWSAHTLQRLPKRFPLHLYLFNSDNPDCASCHANSSKIYIQASNKQANIQRVRRLGLGVGLGLGIPLLIAMAVLLWFVHKSRQQKRTLAKVAETPLLNWKRPSSPPPTLDTPTIQLSVPSHALQQKPIAEVEGGDILELPHTPFGIETQPRNHRAELEDTNVFELRNISPPSHTL
ncbi:hypothetical protein BDV97DRAFT_148141 [Delphinella strobiligena]|nr:hypothetical protein BDV97DRAFT_148141 [Delphinella strobiligena]